MIDKDIVHRASEFASLPWARLDPGRFGKDWSLGRGGHGFSNETWLIHAHTPDPDRGGFITDIWEVPAALGAAIQAVKEIADRNARQDVQNTIKSALGIRS